MESAQSQPREPNLFVAYKIKGYNTLLSPTPHIGMIPLRGTVLYIFNILLHSPMACSSAAVFQTNKSGLSLGSLVVSTTTKPLIFYNIAMQGS